jgi:hypothetical protein
MQPKAAQRLFKSYVFRDVEKRPLPEISRVQGRKRRLVSGRPAEKMLLNMRLVFPNCFAQRTKNYSGVPHFIV